MKRFGIMLVAMGLLVSAGSSIVRGEDENEGKEKKEQTEGQQVRRGERMRPGAGGMFNEWILRRIMSDSKTASELGLSEEQLKTMKDAADQLQAQREPLARQLAELDQESRTLMDKTPVDEAAVMANLEKISKLRLDMEKASVKLMILVKNTLTPEQVEKFKNMALRRPEGRPAGRRRDNAEAAPKTEKAAE